MDYDKVRRLWSIVSEEERRKEVLATTGEKAQEWLDSMQLLAEHPGAHKTLRSTLFKMMIHLSRSTNLLPKCITIQDVEMSSNHPIGGGAFGDVYKGKRRGENVCMKVLRAFRPAEVEQAIKLL
ncbi:hypothetical protein PM082_019168 [Marasmius tenuissimus]|nr:hypothetical protein PM082_019168 [Marasmius tenuissimus]